MAEQVARPHVPWEQAVSSFLPQRPLLAAGVVIGATVAATGVLHVLLGHPLAATGEDGDATLAPGATGALFLSLVLGYATAAFGYLKATLRADLLATGADVETDPGNATAGEMWLSRLAGAVGVAAGLVGVFLIARREGAGFLEVGATEFWSLYLLPVILWVLLRGGFFTVVGVGSLTRESDQPDLDLLNLRPFLGNGRIALRLSLVWIVGVSLVIPFADSDTVVISAGPIVLAALALGVANFVLPVRGIQRRVRRAKREALERIDADLRRLRDAAARGEPAEAGRMADLLAYRRYVEDLREWPFDTPTLARFALLLLIPFGSWVGGALVERLVEVLLD